MPALPTPGGSPGTWGDELNEFLEVVHNADGTVDAASIDVADSGANFTGTDVEAVLAELQDNVDAAGGGDMVVLFDQTLGSDAASIDTDPTSLSGYAHLKIILSLRTTNGSAQNQLLRFNNDSGANYRHRDWVFNSGGTANSAGSSETSALIGSMPGSGATTGYFAITDIMIPEYASTSKLKQLWHNTYDGGHDAATTGGASWLSTSAITRVTVLAAAGNLLAGSRMTIYGMKV